MELLIYVNAVWEKESKRGLSFPVLGDAPPETPWAFVPQMYSLTLLCFFCFTYGTFKWSSMPPSLLPCPTPLLEHEPKEAKEKVIHVRRQFPALRASPCLLLFPVISPSGNNVHYKSLQEAPGHLHGDGKGKTMQNVGAFAFSGLLPFLWWLCHLISLRVDICHKICGCNCLVTFPTVHVRASYMGL